MANVSTVELILRPGMLLAVQYTCFPLSILTTGVCKEDVVLTKPFLVDVEWLVTCMAVVDLYHVILAGGLQYDVIQIRLITCPSINVVAT